MGVWQGRGKGDFWQREHCGVTKKEWAMEYLGCQSVIWALRTEQCNSKVWALGILTCYSRILLPAEAQDITADMGSWYFWLLQVSVNILIEEFDSGMWH